MALEGKCFADSFSDYATPAEACALTIWTAQDFDSGGDPGHGTQSVGAFGRQGRNGLRFTYPASSQLGKINAIYKTLPGVDDTCIFSLAFRYSATHYSGGSDPFIQIMDDATTQVLFAVNPDGTISVYRGDFAHALPSTLLGTSTFAMSAGSFVNINGRVKISNTGGTVDLWFNGSETADLSLAIQDTQSTGNASWSRFSIGTRWNITQTTFNAATWDFCDLVVKDGSFALGGDVGATDPIGDAEVDCQLTLTGNGHYTDWTPLTGSDHGAMVKDNPNDGDTSYNEGPLTAAARDSYKTAPLPTTAGTILLVVVSSVMKKTTAGRAIVKPFVRSGGTDTDGDATIALSTDYVRYDAFFTSFGLTTITPTLVNALESGQQTQ